MTEHRITLTALAQTLADGAHSIFSASGSGLWMNCAGGLLPNLLAPDESGPEAAEGTVAHGVGELWLKTGEKPKHLIGTVQTVEDGGRKFDIEITHEMMNYVQEYVDACAWLPGKHFIEAKVYYSQITPLPKQGGTADHVVCRPGHMTISDLKYGAGVAVEVVGNTQALLYALGFFYEWDWLYDFETIVMRISQPRNGGLSEWTITREELLAFADVAKVKAHAAWALDAPRTPGEKQCQFCRVKASCAAHFHLQAELTAGAFGDMGEPVTVEQVVALKDNIEFQQIVKFTEVYNLSTDEMATLYGYRRLFESWWKSLHNELNIRAAHGETIPGMKLVEARSHRKIKNVSDAVEVLTTEYGLTRKELITEEMASPSAIETLLRKHGVRGKALEAAIAPLVYKPAGKPTLVMNTDRRPAIVDLTEDVFDNLDLETEDETEEY